MRNIPVLPISTGKRNAIFVGLFLSLLIAGIILTLSVKAATANSTASDLLVTKSADVSNPLPDQLVTFSIQIFNSGVISATNGTLTDSLDSDLTFVGPVSIEGGGDTATAGAPPAIASGLTISPSTGVTITFPVRINSGIAAGTVIANTAVADSSEMEPASSNEVNLIVGAVTELIWQQSSAGIFGGQVNALALDPKNTVVIYAGTEDGVFKSRDGGSSWPAATAGLDNHHVESLVLNPLNSKILYAGTEAGVFKSSDGGASWSAASNGITGSSISSLAIDPGDPATLYAGTEAGVFRSSDGGASWTAANAGLTQPQITSLIIDPRHSRTLFAGTKGGGVFKSSNGGSSWAPANSGLANLNVHVLAIDGTNSNTLYAGTGDGLFKSSNGANNWAASGNDLAGLDVLSFAIDPADNKTIYAGTGSGLAKSLNGGSSWTPLSEDNTLALAIDPANSETLYAGTADKGVLKSDDSGDSWNWSGYGLTGTTVPALTIDPVDKNLLFAGTMGSGVFRSSDGGGGWMAANSGLTNGDVYALAFAASGSPLYAGTDGGVFRSSDGGDGWQEVNNGLATLAVRALGAHPTNSNILYAGTDGGGVFASTNGGSSWTAVNNGLTDLNIFALAVDPNDGTILYAGTDGGGVYKSSNSGGSWTAVNNGLTASDVRTLIIEPGNSQVIYAGGPGGVFKSSDGGGSWAASSDGLDDAAVQALAFDPGNNGILYAATAADGVFRSTGSGFNWTAVNDGLAEMNVQAVALASSNTLYAGTTGSGVFFSGPRLAVSKNVDIPYPVAGNTIVYTILISNTGTLATSNGTVNDLLNSGLKFVGPVTVEGGGAAATAGSPPTIASNLSLEPGTTATITLPAKVKPGLGNGTIIPNTAVVDAPQLHTPSSGQALITIYWTNKLVVNKSVDNPNPGAGQTVNFTIEINNIGGHTISGIDVMDVLDSNLTFVGPVQIIGSSGAPGNPPLIASGLEINPGQTISVKFPARVNVQTLPGTVIDNTVQVTSTPWPVPLSSQTQLTVSEPAARYIYVDVGATTGLKDGTSWDNAYTSLQDALLNAGSGGEIWVAAGTYYPDMGLGFTADDPAATFHLRSGVAIYGGFAGTESSLDQRDPEANVTVLSGDVDGNDTAECGVITGAEHIKGKNSTHVVTGSGTTSSAILDGFTITAGHARGATADRHGGGMFNMQGSPTLANLIFCGNKAEGSGGGMHNDGSSPTLSNLVFEHNEANVVSGCGGGMENVNGSQPILNDVLFSGNQAYYGGGIFNSRSKTSINRAVFSANVAAWGGGIFNSDGSDGTVSGGSFTSNEATGGGGLANDSSSPRLTDITFAANVVSQAGGGMSSSGGDPALINTVFSGNLAEAQANGQQSWGGGLFISGGQPALANATLSGNWAAAKGNRPEDEGLGGGLFVAAGTVTIDNSIFWDNEGDQSRDILVSAGGATHISYSRLDGCPQYSLCDNLVNDDPQFTMPVDPTRAPTVDGDLSLRPGSPLVDAGDNGLVPAGIVSDRAGQPRIYNGIVDMGAFELPIACPASGVERLYVDETVSGGDNSGLGWDNALSKLSHAFALAQGCRDTDIGEVWVAAGKYIPTDGSYAAAGARDTSFDLRNGLAVYGGFAGSELVLEEREWLANWTILSGDIEGDDLADANGIVTDTAKIVGDNSYHVITSVGNDNTAVLDGFIVNGGQADGDAGVGEDSGGGVYNKASSPTLRNLMILSNLADDGGGMANVSNSSPLLTNVLLETNSAVYFGGGMFNQSSSPTLINVALSDNRATSGGGMFNAISSPLVTNGTFAGNKAIQQVTINSQQITDNDCESQGAGCRSLDLGDTAGATGSGGGMYNLNNSRPQIANSIFWQNQDDNGSGTAAATIRNDASSIPIIAYSLVEASGGSGSGWDGSMGVDHGQNLDVDPLFIAIGDPRLQIGSPAIDVGDSSANGSEHDLDGNPRVIDGNNDGEAGIDLGAYETPLVAISVSHTADVTTAKVGDTITFTYFVTNSGEVSLNDVKASDDKLGNVTLDDTQLEPGETTSGILAYTLQESDVGTLVTKVTASGKSDAGAEVSDEDTAAIEVRPGVYRSFIPVLLKD